MYSLFIDTHDSKIIIALFKDGALFKEKTKDSSRNHSDYTMPLLKELLDESNVSVKNISEIIAVNGPGSFTGVRIGVTIAKTLAYTLDIPIKTITSLEMLAVSSNIKTKKIVTIHDIKGVFYGIFDEQNNLIDNLDYKSNEEFKRFTESTNIPVIDILNIDFNALYKYMEKKETTPAHAVNPIYIKVIEALKND